MRTLEEISTDIVNTRLQLEAIGMTNVSGRKVEDLIALQVARTQAEMQMAILEGERKGYMALANAQTAAFTRGNGGDIGLDNAFLRAAMREE